jgi:N-acetylmuramoyl-L-alanine amidase
MILSTALICLSLNIYHESRSESVIGQYAVANVTMNRAGQDESKVCKVVLKRKQFSWTTGLVKKDELKKAGMPKDEDAWKKAQTIARVTLDRKMGGFDFTGGAKFYHTKSVHPKWRKSMLATKVIGQHIFYKQT